MKKKTKVLYLVQNFWAGIVLQIKAAIYRRDLIIITETDATIALNIFNDKIKVIVVDESTLGKELTLRDLIKKAGEKVISIGISSDPNITKTLEHIGCRILIGAKTKIFNYIPRELPS